MQSPRDSALEAVEPAARLYQAGRLAESADACRKILEADPGNVHALHLSGLVAAQRGDALEAIGFLEKAAGLGYSDAAMLNNLGQLHRAEGRLAEAERCYRKAMQLRQGYEEAEANLALLLDTSGRLERSPRNYLTLGVMLERLGRADEAEEVYRRALSLQPASAPEHHSVGLVKERLGRTEDAAASIRTALELDPGLADAHHDLGNLLLRLKQFDAAEQCYRRALALRPGFPLATFALSQLLLLRGDYAAGLPLYESRTQGASQESDPAFRATVAQLAGAKRWTGEAADGGRLLLWTEQGFGDSIMAARYLRLLKSRTGARLIVYCEPALARLVEAMGCVDEVMSKEIPIPQGTFDLHCPMMSLPLACGTRLESIPAEVPYLSVPPALARKWTARLAALPRPRIGLAWAGGRMYRGEPMRTRSVAPQELGPIVGTAGASFVSLQKGEASGLETHAHRNIRDWMHECGDFLETAALIEQLDLVISVDTSVAHLAGALGKPVWMFNRFESEWRWQVDRGDSPWYPTMRIFNQQVSGSWSAPIEQVAAALREFVATRQPRYWLRRWFAKRPRSRTGGCAQ